MEQMGAAWRGLMLFGPQQTLGPHEAGRLQREKDGNDLEGGGVREPGQRSKAQYGSGGGGGVRSH